MEHVEHVLMNRRALELLVRDVQASRCCRNGKQGMQPPDCIACQARCVGGLPNPACIIKPHSVTAAQLCRLCNARTAFDQAGY